MPQVILGIDPGVSETGWAVLCGGNAQDVSLRASGLIRTTPKQNLPERLCLIHREIARLIELHRPQAVAVEEMFFLRAAHTIRATLQARGVVLLAAAQAGCAISEHNPRSVKAALTGNGSADKVQMQRVVSKALGLRDLLRPDDVADAAAIAICHWRCGRLKRLKVLEMHGGCS